MSKETKVFVNKYNLFIKEIIKNKDKSVKSESPALLDFLLDLSTSGSELTTDEIVDEIKTFVAAVNQIIEFSASHLFS